MALIQGTSGNELEVDVTSKAARVILYKKDGTEGDPQVTGAYAARIEIVPSTLTSGTVYWAIRNNHATLTVYLRKFELKLGFSGIAAATRSAYEMIRFSGATPTGGTALPPVKRRTTYANSLIDARFAPAGLTMTGTILDTSGAWHTVGHTNQLNVDHAQNIASENGFELLPGEGLAIRASGALVLGSYLVGSVRWEER